MSKDTKFKPGQSGNPKGKPKGAIDKRTKYRELLEPHAENLITKVVENALGGDTACLKICIDRLVSPYRATDSEVKIDNFKGSIDQKGNRVIEKMGMGELSPSDAASMLSALASQARIIEFCDLEDRVAMLEEKNGFKK